MAFVSAIEAVSIEGGSEPFGVVDEKHGGFDIVFLPQFAEEYFGKTGRIRGKEPNVKELVRFGIDSGVQPVLLIVDSNQSFVECNVIRARTAFGL